MDIISLIVQAAIFAIMVFLFFQTMRWNIRKDIADQIAMYNTRISNLKLDDLIKSTKRYNSSAETDLDLDCFSGRRVIAYYVIKFSYVVLNIKFNQHNLKVISSRFFTYYSELRVICEGLVQLILSVNRVKSFSKREKVQTFNNIKSCLSSFEVGILAIYIFQHSERKILEGIFNCYDFNKNADEIFIQFVKSGPFGNHTLPPPQEAYDFIMRNRKQWHRIKKDENQLTSFCDPPSEKSNLVLFLYALLRHLYSKEEHKEIFDSGPV